MDKVIKRRGKKTKIIIVLFLLIIMFFISKKLLGNYTTKYNLKKSEIIISEVIEKEISESIQAIGIVEPLTKVTIESPENGIITSIIKSSGSYINENEIIMVLSNRELENEYSMTTEELERQKKLLEVSINEFSSNKIDFSETLLELNHKISEFKNDIIKNKQLLYSGTISEKVVENSENELKYWLEKKSILNQKLLKEEELQKSREGLIELEIRSITKKILLIEEKIKSLNITTLHTGVLTLDNFYIGQNITRMQRLGSIDKQDSFKLTAEIDEFYLSKLNIGDRAIFKLEGDNSEYEASLSFISPGIIQNRVKLEFSFTANSPKSLRSGQSLNIKIIKDRPEIRTVIENGNFIKESNGNWIYRITDNIAVKVQIKTGIKNSNYIEVLSGLTPGDKVIVSDYIKYKNYEKLIIEE